MAEMCGPVAQEHVVGGWRAGAVRCGHDAGNHLRHGGPSSRHHSSARASTGANGPRNCAGKTLAITAMSNALRRSPKDHPRLHSRGNLGEIVDLVVKDLAARHRPSESLLDIVDIADEEQAQRDANAAADDSQHQAIRQKDAQDAARAAPSDFKMPMSRVFSTTIM